MGLDSFWKALETDAIPPKFEPELRLCGGMFSANGEGSFRGKVYNDLIERVTGESLYQETIDNTTVRKMADALDQLTETDKEGSIYKQRTAWDITAAEVRDIKRMFRAYADAGYSLVGWW